MPHQPQHGRIVSVEPPVAARTGRGGVTSAPLLVDVEFGREPPLRPVPGPSSSPATADGSPGDARHRHAGRVGRDGTVDAGRRLARSADVARVHRDDGLRRHPRRRGLAGRERDRTRPLTFEPGWCPRPDGRAGTIAHDRPPGRHPRHRRRGPAVQRHPRPARGHERIAGLLLGPVRWRADAVRGRPVHDDRGHGRGQDRPAALFGRVTAGRRRLGRLRVLRPPGQGRHVHAAAVADADRPARCG